MGNPTDGRGRHLDSERGERLAFVGAVASQLLVQGFATHSGLKAYGQRVPTAKEREIKYSLSIAIAGQDESEVKRLLAAIDEESWKADSGDGRTAWVIPPAAVWKAIESAPFNADCLALAAAWFGKLICETRNAKLRGVGHSSLTPRRESSCGKYWKAIEGMSRQTASYWKSKRESEYSAARVWFGKMLVAHGLASAPAKRADLATVLRDDLKDVRAGRAVKEPRTDCRAPLNKTNG